MRTPDERHSYWRKDHEDEYPRKENRKFCRWSRSGAATRRKGRREDGTNVSNPAVRVGERQGCREEAIIFLLSLIFVRRDQLARTTPRSVSALFFLPSPSSGRRSRRFKSCHPDHMFLVRSGHIGNGLFRPGTWVTPVPGMDWVRTPRARSGDRRSPDRTA